MTEIKAAKKSSVWTFGETCDIINCKDLISLNMKPADVQKKLIKAGIMIEDQPN